MFKTLHVVLRGLGRKLAYSLGGPSRFCQRLAWPQTAGRLLSWLAWSSLIGMLLLAGYLLILLPLTPDMAEVRKAHNERPSVLLAADGREIAIFRRLNREWVPQKSISRHVINALIATEDRRFYSHHGIDLRRTVSAAVFTLFGQRQGGSTLTQQLARNLFHEEIGRAPTVTRKFKEAITALKLEQAYSKDQILEIYLNTVPFLYNANGIEMAARTYFNTSAAALGPLEAATLVGMLKGTAYYNPVLNPERALERRNRVLAQMVDQAYLSRERYEVLRQRPLGLDFERQQPAVGLAPHFAERVRRWLVTWAKQEGYDIYADGLVIHSTLDSRLQRLANEAVAEQLAALQMVAEVEWGMKSVRLLSPRLADYAQARRRVPSFRQFWRAYPDMLATFVRESPEYARLLGSGVSGTDAEARLLADEAFLAELRARKTRLEAGLVAMDPRNGAIRAWVGSRDFGRDGYDHVALARRQPGSTFKAFVYAAALEQGMHADQAFIDQPVAIRLADGRLWQPGDVGTASGEPMTLEEGLVYSKNSITAQVMAAVGPTRVVQLARRAGVRDSPLDPVPALALGTSPVTLLEMVAGYGTLASLGEYTAPLLITRVSDRQGRILVEFHSERERALSQATAVRIIDMLRGAVDRGTGRGLRQNYRIDADVAGKTGTTQNNTDGWFILMHPELVAGAWVGFNDSRVRMRSDYWGQGAHNALPVVGGFFHEALVARAINRDVRFPEPPRPRPLEAALERAGHWILEIFGLGPGRAPRPSSPP